MSLQGIMKEEEEILIRKYGGSPLNQEIWRKYCREMEENRKRFEIEEKVRVAKTHRLAITTVIVCLLLSLYSHAGEEKTYGDKRLSSVVRVYDGDTFYGTIRTWPGIIGDTIGIRINGVDTPEMRGVPDSIKALAVKARELTESMVMSGKWVTLKNIRRDKYFRILADVWVGGKVTGKSVAEELIKAGLAKPYDGGTKEGW